MKNRNQITKFNNSQGEIKSMSERDITSSSDILTLAKEESFYFLGKDNGCSQDLKRYKKALSEYNYLKHKKEQLKKDIIELFEKANKEKYYPLKVKNQELATNFVVDLFNVSDELEKKRKILASLEHSKSIKFILETESKILWSYSNSELYMDFEYSTPIFDDILMVYYYELYNDLKNVNTVANVPFELIPIMFMVFSASLANIKSISEKDAEPIYDSFVCESEQLVGDLSLELFEKRISLYTKVVAKQIKPHYEWLLWNAPKKSHPLADCVGVFGDILFNPDCADNYENSPISIQNIFEIKTFAESMMSASKKLDEFKERIKKRITGEKIEQSKTFSPLLVLAIIILAIIGIWIAMIALCNA